MTKPQTSKKESGVLEREKNSLCCVCTSPPPCIYCMCVFECRHECVFVCSCGPSPFCPVRKQQKHIIQTHAQFISWFTHVTWENIPRLMTGSVWRDVLFPSHFGFSLVLWCCRFHHRCEGYSSFSVFCSDPSESFRHLRVAVWSYLDCCFNWKRGGGQQTIPLSDWPGGERRQHKTRLFNFWATCSQVFVFSLWDGNEDALTDPAVKPMHLSFHFFFLSSTANTEAASWKQCCASALNSAPLMCCLITNLSTGVSSGSSPAASVSRRVSEWSRQLTHATWRRVVLLMSTLTSEGSVVVKLLRAVSSPRGSWVSSVELRRRAVPRRTTCVSVCVCVWECVWVASVCI